MSQNSFEIKIKLPNGTEESHSFTQEIVTVGRSKLNNLCLDIDKKISRKHFAFNFKEQVLSVVIENTVTNPVLLNGKQIFGLNIVDSGQTIQIGDSLIEIIRVTQLNQTENFPDIEIEEVDPQAEKTRVVQLDNFNPTQTENYDGNQIAEIYSKIEAVHKKRVEEVSGVHKIVEVTSEHKQQSNSDINGLDPEDEFTESASSVPNKKLIFYVACGLLIALSVAMLFFGKNKETFNKFLILKNFQNSPKQPKPKTQIIFGNGLFFIQIV